MKSIDTSEGLIQFLSDFNEANAQEKMNAVAEYLEDYSKDEWEYLWDTISKSNNERLKVIMLWECLWHSGKTKQYEYYLKFLKKTDILNWNEKYFMLWQVSRKLFANPGLGSFTCKKHMYEIYHSVLCDYMSNFTDLEYISDRNSSLVLVTVQQFLSLSHGPTKTTLDRAFCLKRDLGKEVIIINTAELLGGQPIEILNGSIGNYNSELTKQTQVEYRGEIFPYMQFDNNMPNIDNSKEFISYLKMVKPAYIVNIGGESLLVDMSSKLVPVLNINTVPSDIDRTESTMQAMGRGVTKEDEEVLKIIEKSKDDVIVGRFTSSLKEQSHRYTKQDLGLPDNRMILAVIGGRLTEEVDDAFIKMLDDVLDAGAFVVVIGVMNTYEKFCEKDVTFAQNSRYLGMQDDVLAILDCCDIYVNPKRSGGGTSVIEAMYKGMPAVTLSSGDVALGAGSDFVVSDYSDMAEMIKRYMTDSQFYKDMSVKAKKRADYMLDSFSAFTEIIDKFEQHVKKMEEENGQN